MNYKKFVGGLVALAAILVLWGYSTPYASGPDDDFHVQSAFCAHGDQANICIKSQFEGYFYLPTEIQDAYECQVQFGPACLSPKYRNNKTSEMLLTNRVNAGMKFYPNLFYTIQGLVVNRNVETSIFRMRLLNIAVVMTLLAATYLSVSKRLKRALIGTVALGVTPVCLWVFASNNPSSWAIIGSLTYFINLMNLFDSDSENKNFSLVVLVTSAVIAVDARSDAALGLLLITGVWILCQLKWGNLGRSKTRVKFVIGSTVAYMATRLISIRQSQMLIDTKGDVLDTNYVLNMIHNIQSLPDLFLGAFSVSISSISEGSWRFLGGVGRLNVGVPSTVGIFYLVVLATAIIGSIKAIDRANKSFLQIVFVVMAGGALWLLQINDSTVGNLVQPRYLLPLLLIWIAAALSCWPSNYMPFWIKKKGLFVVFASAANTIAMNAVVNFYSSGSESAIPGAKHIYWSRIQAPSAIQLTLLTLVFSAIWYNYCFEALSPITLKNAGDTSLQSSTNNLR